MATCTRVELRKMKDKNKTRYVKYYYDDGTVVERVGGSKSWRNNNPGNVVWGPGRIGKDGDGIARFPDLSTGRKARKLLFMLGGKFYDRASAREMIRGLYDKDGHQINGTGYAPKYDKDGKVINDPDAHADFVRQYFRKYYRVKHNEDMDIEKTKIRDYTPEMQDVLEEAQEAYEQFKEGTVRKYDATGRLVGNASGESFPDNAAASSRWTLGTSAQAGGRFVPDHDERPNALGPIDPAIWDHGAPPIGPNSATPNAYLGPVGRPNALGPIPPMWEPSALPIGPNQLAGVSPLNLPPAAASPPFHYSPSGVRGPSSPAQPASVSLGYPTRPLPSDSPLFPRRNLLEPAGSMSPWGQPQSGRDGSLVPSPRNVFGPWPGTPLEGPPDLPQSGSRNVFGPWPGSYPAGWKNLPYPDLERLLRLYPGPYAPSGQTWPPG